MREHAHYFRVSRRERENRGLSGGEGRIRIPETLQDLRGGIQPEFGATIRPEQKDPRRRLSESAVALLEMWDGKSCRQEILRSMRECFHCFKNARDPGA